MFKYVLLLKSVQNLFITIDLNLKSYFFTFFHLTNQILSTVLSKTRSKFQFLIENYAKLIIKIKRIVKILIFKYITKSCYLIIYGLENIFKEK